MAAVEGVRCHGRGACCPQDQHAYPARGGSYRGMGGDHTGHISWGKTKVHAWGAAWFSGAAAATHLVARTAQLACGMAAGLAQQEPSSRNSTRRGGGEPVTASRPASPRRRNQRATHSSMLQRCLNESNERSAGLSGSRESQRIMTSPPAAPPADDAGALILFWSPNPTRNSKHG